MNAWADSNPLTSRSGTVNVDHHWSPGVTLLSTIELVDLPLKAQIGIFSADDTDPYEHRLDLTLAVNPKLVLVKKDGMSHVFDYDPLLEEIHRISQARHYETQEMLASLIVRCCATFEQIHRVEIHLKKFRPDGSGSTASGTIGVRLSVSGDDLMALRGVQKKDSLTRSSVD